MNFIAETEHGKINSFEYEAISKAVIEMVGRPRTEAQWQQYNELMTGAMRRKLRTA